jgi:uncharacterized repeat protein (TIGR01451 family)
MNSIRFAALTALFLLVPAASEGGDRTSDLSPAPANLSITNDDGVTRVIPSRHVRYVVTVTNLGPEIATGARVRDLPPPELVGVAWHCTVSGGASCTPDSPTPALSGIGGLDQPVRLPPGGRLVFTIGGTLSPEARGTLSNTATVSPPPGVPDLNLADNTATDVDEVLRPFILSKEVSGSFVPGGAVLYTITITNDTSVLQPDNDTPELEDFLPPELVATAATASSGTVDLDPASDRITWNGSIPPGATVTLTIEATIRSGTEGREVANQGELHFALSLDPSTDALGNGATNDGLAFTEDLRTGGPTIFQVLSTVLSVPALDTLGLLLLALLLGLIATGVLGRS